MAKEATKKLEEYKHTRPEQLLLFESPQDKNKYSNTIELYDAIPKYFWYSKATSEDISAKPIERKFVHKGADYQVAVSPAWIKDKKGEYKSIFPGQREELVEDALRKLACESGRGVFLDNESGVVFSLYELQKELQRMGHGYKIMEIKDAIMICGKSNIEVTGSNGKNIVLSNIFTTVGLTTKDDWKSHSKKSEAYIRFNPLVTKSIKERSFRLIDYDKCMSFKIALARWLHKRMSHNFTQASLVEPYSIKLSTILRDSGAKAYPKLVDSLRQVRKALEEMKAKEAIFKYNEEKVMDKRKLIDVKFTLFPHTSFIGEVKHANGRARRTLENGKVSTPPPVKSQTRTWRN